MSTAMTRVTRSVIAREGGFVDGERVEYPHAALEFVGEDSSDGLHGGQVLLWHLHPDGKKMHSQPPVVMHSPRLRRLRGQHIAFEGLVELRPDGSFSPDPDETWDEVNYCLRREHWVQAPAADVRSAGMASIVELSEQSTGGYE